MNLPKRKQIVIMAASSLLIASLLSLAALAQTPSSTFWISSGIYPTDTFTVWNEGSNYYCKNRQGQLVYDADHTNASYVINSALAGLTSGRTWQETVRLRGAFTITHTILVDAYTRLVIDGNITLADNRNCTMIQNSDGSSQQWFIDIVGGTLEGNRGNQNAGNGIFFNATQRSTIKDVRIEHVYEDAILLDGSFAAPILWCGVGEIVGCYLFECGGDGIQSNVYVADWIISDNNIGGCDEFGMNFQSGSGGHTIDGNLIWNNGNTSVGYAGIYVYDADAITITGNRIDYNGAQGINHYGDWGTITGNTLFGNSYRTGYWGSYAGITLYNSTNCTISAINSFNVAGQPYQGWGIQETGSSNWNAITSSSCLLNTVAGIVTVGANSSVNSCFNGTTWISSGTGATGPQGPPGGVDGRLPYDYLVWRNATNTYMVDGATGVIDYAGSSTNAIQFALGNTTDGLVVLSANTYTVTSTLTISNELTFKGWGYGETIISTASALDPMLSIEATGVQVWDLTFDGNDAATDGIEVDNPNCRLYRVEVMDVTQDGIVLGDGSSITGGRVDFCRVSSAGRYGINVADNFSDSHIVGCLIRGYVYADPSACIALSEGTCFISENHLWGAHSGIKVISGVDGVIIEDNFIDDHGKHNIWCVARLSHSVIANNKFRWADHNNTDTYDSIHIDSTFSYNTISGNYFTGTSLNYGTICARYAIFAEGSYGTYNSITGNVFHSYDGVAPWVRLGANNEYAANIGYTE